MMYKIGIIALSLLLLSGCWSRRELNELLIVLGVAVDWEDGEYLVSYQVVNPSEISSQTRAGDRPPGTLFQSRGKTLFEAARSLTAEAPRKVYLGHLQLYVISENLAREGLRDYLDNMLRDNEFRMDFNLVVARGTRAENILKVFTPIEKLPTYSMLQSLQTSQRSWAPTVSITLDEVLNKLSEEGSELALTGIQIMGNKEMADSKKNVEKFLPQSKFRYNGIAAFKKGKLIGWLNEKESKGYSDITDSLKSTSIELACDKNTYMGIEITSSNSKIEMKVNNGKPESNVQIKAEATIVENPCKDLDLTDVETIKKLQDGVEKIIQSNAEAAVSRTQKMKADILGFGSKLGKTEPVFWDQVKNEWNDKYYPELKVHYDIELLIRRTGTIGNSTLD